jgi:hypothetical protein
VASHVRRPRVPVIWFSVQHAYWSHRRHSIRGEIRDPMAPSQGVPEDTRQELAIDSMRRDRAPVRSQQVITQCELRVARCPVGFQKWACASELRDWYAPPPRHDRESCPCVCSI